MERCFFSLHKLTAVHKEKDIVLCTHFIYVMYNTIANWQEGQMDVGLKLS